jgi:hypothetical protein
MCIDSTASNASGCMDSSKLDLLILGCLYRHKVAPQSFPRFQHEQKSNDYSFRNMNILYVQHFSVSQT